jgi:bacillithiol biosynthesis cysteine-adding enzyme BshC
MNPKNIKYQSFNTFHPLVNCYFKEDEAVKNLYHRFPKLENFEAQILEKKENYSNEIRNTLVKSLQIQNQNINLSSQSSFNINALKKENTFTITTGHQLNLFTGPVYCIYKIVSVINLCETLKKQYPNYYFVPVFWMASEDHDIDEIRFFNYNNQKITFESENLGAVGKISTENVKPLFEIIDHLFPDTENGVFLKELFQKAYQLKTLADATRFLVNTLFGDKGIVILDGDDALIKQKFSGILKKELTQQFVFEEITKSFAGDKIKLQVNPRNINLFYLDENLRERIVFENNLFKINNTNLSFSQVEILDILEKNPEKFSPNALLRPVYQEYILPNLCYVGGAAEIAYWLELKSSFEAINLTFPMLLMRNSALILKEKQVKKLEKLNLSLEDLLETPFNLIEKISKNLAKNKIDFEVQKQFLKDQFYKLYEIAKTTDISFDKAVAAQEKKQLNGLEKLEKKLKKAEKRKNESFFKQIELLQKELFQDNTWQERHQNFSSFYLEYGDKFFTKLDQNFNPLDAEFNFFKLE